MQREHQGIGLRHAGPPNVSLPASDVGGSKRISAAETISVINQQPGVSISFEKPVVT
jgi:hypothetical protein